MRRRHRLCAAVLGAYPGRYVDVCQEVVAWCTEWRRAVNSIVLLTNGISFALQAVVLLIIGAWADYGTWRSVSDTLKVDLASV